MRSNSGYESKLAELTSELCKLPDGEHFARALLEGRDFIEWFRNDTTHELLDLELVSGCGPQNLGGTPIPTDFDSYVSNVINPQILAGTITDGTVPGEYDDRKARCHHYQLIRDPETKVARLKFEIGPTTYQRYQEDINRDRESAVDLLLRGVRDYQDPFAYFSRAMGVTVVPILEDRTVYIGERNSEVDCSGLLNFVAGMATFQNSVSEIDFLEDARRELEEEVYINLQLGEHNTRFVGISGNPFTSEIDLVFVVKTNTNPQHFEQRSFPEHTKLVPIKNKDEAESLLTTGKLPNGETQYPLSYGSRLGLEYLTEFHFK